MGWTDDPDTEGVVEENPYIFAIMAIIALIVASYLTFIGIDYDISGIQMNQIIMAIILIIGIAMAVAIGTGHKIGIGAVFLFVLLLAVIGMVNLWNAGAFDSFQSNIQEKGWAYTIGQAIGQFTAGLATSDAGKWIGLGCIAVGIILVVIPNFSTPIGVLLIIIGSGLAGPTVYNEVHDWWAGGDDGEPGGSITDTSRAGQGTDYLTGAAVGGTAAAAITAGLILTGTGPGAIAGIPLIAIGLAAGVGLGGASGHWVNWDFLWNVFG